MTTNGLTRKKEEKKGEEPNIKDTSQPIPLRGTRKLVWVIFSHLLLGVPLM
jgi:hypothetical protein